MRILDNKNIVVGISGSIAAYKAADLISRLKSYGANVRVVMTSSSSQFITITTLESLSGNKVIYENNKSSISNFTHLDIAKWADILVIAPCTANLMNKIANGVGDDLLTTICLAYNKKLFIVPAMNPDMWTNKITQSSVKRLEKNKINIIGPEYGKHACGDTGYGRMSSTEYIIEQLENFQAQKILSGINFLVTAGPTREPLDPVRFISNYSSGKMGYAISLVAKQLGAEVTLISGPTSLNKLDGIDTTYVETSDQMITAVRDKISNTKIFISTAAISDYHPVKYSKSKYKKSSDRLTIEFERGTDILQMIAEQYPDIFTVGFAAETENLLENATKKLQSKKIDMIVANIANYEKNIGFGSDYNKVTIISNDGSEEEIDSSRKIDVAYKILKNIHKNYFITKKSLRNNA
tara:strand:- start:1814 stop:3040 length:1227 start_codon:yes stop_codon:yes gene_type:complete